MSSIKNIIISQATYNSITDKSVSGILSYLATQNLYNPSTQVPIVYLESTKKVLCNGTLYGEVNLDDINSLKGAANGIAELNGNGKVPASQLPSYVDDIVNGYYHEDNFYEDDTYQTLITPTTGKIYYDLATGKQYRWSDVVYAEIIDMQPMSASNVTYSNTNSTILANNIQDVIDELDRKIYDAGNYETILLTIGSADSSFNPVGQTITVTLEDGSATQYKVLESRQISFTVQRGMRYTISGTSTADYRCLPISFIARMPTRYITMRYIPIATGVFILQKDGNYYLREEYDAETMAENAVGVLVLTSALINAGFGIVITDFINITKQYGTTYPSVNYNDLHSGFNNTAFINTKSTDTNVAAVYVKNMSIDIEGQTMQGYIGCHPEWQIIKANITEINNAFQALGYSNRLYAGTAYTTVSYAGKWYSDHKWYNSNSVVGDPGNGENYQNRSVVPFYRYSLN